MFQNWAINNNCFFDQGKFGDILPAEQIIPNSLEVLDSLIAMVGKAKSLKYL